MPRPCLLGNGWHPIPRPSVLGMNCLHFQNSEKVSFRDVHKLAYVRAEFLTSSDVFVADASLFWLKAFKNEWLWEQVLSLIKF
jgi:hypothetical protein